MVEASTGGSIINWRWLVVHLAEGTGRMIEALRGGVSFRSILGTSDLVTLDFDGLLRFDQVIIQLLQCSSLSIDFFMQVTDVLKEKLFLGLHLSESCLVLGKIIMYLFVGLVQVRNLAVFFD